MLEPVLRKFNKKNYRFLLFLAIRSKASATSLMRQYQRIIERKIKNKNIDTKIPIIIYDRYGIRENVGTDENVGADNINLFF